MKHLKASGAVVIPSYLITAPLERTCKIMESDTPLRYKTFLLVLSIRLFFNKIAMGLLHFNNNAIKRKLFKEVIN